MSVIDSSRAKPILGISWIVFASINTYLTFVLPGEETIPYHLVWASFALVYGFYPWSRALTWTAFWAVTAITGLALIQHAQSGIIGFSECSEIALMGLLVSLLIWHVDRHRAVQNRLIVMQQEERRRSQSRELATRFGSHEARTRLTIIRGFVEVMAAGSTDPGLHQDAAVVLDELDKTSLLITNLMTLVNASDSGTRVPIDVDQVIAAVVHRWVATADRDWQSASETGVVWGDGERLEALLDCLMENAVKFTSPGDTIAVQARTEGQTLVLAVRDTGAGIPPEDVDRVFDIFQTGSTAGDRAGNGLGLSIVQAIAQARHGTVQVESTVGVGTCFTLRFDAPGRAEGGAPRSGAAAGGAEPEPAAQPAPTPALAARG